MSCALRICKDDLDWATPKRVMQPLQTFAQAVQLPGTADTLPDGIPKQLPKAYIYCTRPGPGDVFRQFAERVKTEPGWKYFEIDASHNPHITAPQALMRILQSLL